MVRVFTAGRCSVHVYQELGQPHHLPHCHVRWSDGESVLALPTLVHLAGDRLPAAARRTLTERIEDVWAAWVELNPSDSAR